MTLPLRGVNLAEVEQRLARGEYSSLTAGLEVRRFNQIQPLVGRRWQFNTADQQAVRVLTLTPSQHCLWCRRKVKEDENIGIPLQMSRKDGVVYIVDRGCHCSFECAAAVLKRESGWPAPMRNPDHSQSWELLHLIYRWVYPGKRLQPAPDYTITDSNIPAAIEASRSVFVRLNGLVSVQTAMNFQMIPTLGSVQ